MSNDETKDQPVNLFPLPIPAYSRPSKQSYDGVGASRPIVIDNGSYCCRVGWAGESSPRVTFRNQIFRPRDKVTGSSVTVVGDWGQGLKGYDCAKSASKDAFDNGVVCNFETQEYVFDFAFERLSIAGSSIRHPVMLTEAALSPGQCRAGMAELLFEAYGIPSLHFAVDSVCAYLYCARKGHCGRSGIVVGSGHSATHVIPMLEGRPLMEQCSRLRACGSLATDRLHRTMCARYPQHVMSLSMPSTQLLKEQFSYTAQNYKQELAEIQHDAAKAESQGVLIQLPWKPEKGQSKEEAEAEAARKLARAENNRQRLKEMAEQRKLKSIGEKEEYLELLQKIARQVEETDSQEEANYFLSHAGLKSEKDLEKALQEVQASLRKLRGEEPKTNGVPAKDEPVFDLVDIPDAELTSEQVKEKRKQKMLKGARDARELRKRVAEGEREIARQKAAAEEERLQHDPTAYLAHISQLHKAVAERIQGRKRRHLGVAVPEVGPGKRTSADQRTRMRLIAQAAFDKGPKGLDDDFGRDDRDWEVYKHMDKNFSDSDEAAEDEREYTRTAERLQVLGAQTEVVDVIGEQAANNQQQKPLQAEDYQIWVGVERMLGPELLFQPSLTGVDQAGVAEVIISMLQRLPRDVADVCARGTVLLTGGNAAFKGLDQRLFAELQACRPLGQPMRVVRSLDCVLDAWRGAAMLAAKSGFFKTGITRADYLEKGPDYLKLYRGPRYHDG